MKHTVEIDIPITPHQLAEAFCDMCNDHQAEFFGHLWAIAKTWPGAGWCQQSCAIAAESDNDAIQAIRTLASHLPKEDVEWIMAASQDGAV